MKKLIMLTMIVLSLSSCSMIPRLNFDTPNTVPQAVDRSKLKETCKGDAVFSETGDILSCTRGYMSYAENYQKIERKMTFVERIKSFINNLMGWSFWIVIALVIFLPTTAGLLIGRILEGAVGISTNALKSVVRAVQRARKQGKPLDEALDAQLDEKYKKYIRDMKDKEGIK